jgi:hypothetical protein
VTGWVGRALAAGFALAAGCAHSDFPPGGPVPETPPQLLSVRPDTMAIVPGYRGPVVFAFDATIVEQGVEEAVTVSPRTSPFTVDRSGREIRVGLRRGWEPGRIYHVEVGPGIADRFQNRRTEPIRLVFSTGPEIPGTRATGVVTDRITGQPVVGGRVEAILQPDSLVYVVRTDSAGRFEVRHVPEGDYLVRAFVDADRDRALGPLEARDTARLAIRTDTVPSLRLVLLPHDTTPPVAGTAAFEDGWVEVRFDDHLDPDQPLSPAQVTLVGPDGRAVPVEEVRIGTPVREREPEAADEEGPAPAPPRAPAAAPPAAEAAPDAVPAGPLPSRSLSARPAEPLLPDTTYTVTVTGVRNINGLLGGGEAPLRTPSPAPEPPPADPPTLDVPEPDPEPADPQPNGPAEAEDPPPAAAARGSAGTPRVSARAVTR